MQPARLVSGDREKRERERDSKHQESCVYTLNFGEFLISSSTMDYMAAVQCGVTDITSPQMP